jgi:hypothetical protein
MARRFYLVTRDLHLYAGLLLSPFILVFAVSVFYLVHFRPPSAPAGPPRVVTGVLIPANLEQLAGRDLAAALRGLLDRLGVAGEINFVQWIAKERRLVIPVMLPGYETTVDLNLEQRTASVSQRRTGTVDALIHLHKMPGPHNASMRGNSSYMRLWRVLADATTYGVLFLTLSGVYLWAVLRGERQIGGILLLAGAVTFAGLVYALTY